MASVTEILEKAAAGAGLADHDALALSEFSDTNTLLSVAGGIRDLSHPNTISYSRKVFIPLTHHAEMCATTALLRRYPEK